MLGPLATHNGKETPFMYITRYWDFALQFESDSFITGLVWLY